MLYEHSGLNDLKKRLAARLSELDTKEDGYLDLVNDPDWPKAKIQKKLAGIEQERAEIQAQVADTTSKLDTGRQFFTLALELLSDPQGFYQRGNHAVKKAIVKIIFGRISLDAFDRDGQEQAATVASHELIDGIDALVEVGTPTSSRYSRTVTGSLTASEAPSRRKEPRSTCLPKRSCLPPSLRTTVQVEPLWWAILGLNQ